MNGLPEILDPSQLDTVLRDLQYYAGAPAIAHYHT